MGVFLDLDWAGGELIILELPCAFIRYMTRSWVLATLNIPISHEGELLATLVENMVEKEPHSFFHCCSFDHHDMQSSNECRFVFLVLRLHS